MSVPQPKSEAHPESRAAGRQPGFSIDAAPQAPPETGRVSLDATPGSLPSAYEFNRLWCIARDPHSLYVYWQLALPVHRFPGARLAIAVHRANGAHESTAILGHPAGTRFIAVSAPDSQYHLSLGFLPSGKLEREDMLFVVARASVRTPRLHPVVAGETRDAEGAVLSSRASRSPEVLALLFPNLAAACRVAPGDSSWGTAQGGPPGPRHRVPLPPERGGFHPLET